MNTNMIMDFFKLILHLLVRKYNIDIMQQINDSERPVTSSFYKVRHNMAILTHYETVYIAKNIT